MSADEKGTSAELLAAALARELRDLEVLEAATAELDREAEVESVLGAIVEHARALLDAPFGALIVQEPDGTPRHFLHSGVSPAQARRIGADPRGHGLLGLGLREGGTLRVEDARTDARSRGVPRHHPAMHALLVVSVPCGPDARAELYVADDRPDRRFEERDEALLRRFALRAGLAIARSRHHRRHTDLEIAVERDRLARELHDDTAQVLSYVHLTAQGAIQLLEQGRLDEARERLARMSGAAKSAAADLRSGIRALRHASDPDRPLHESVAEYAELWSADAGVRLELDLDPGVDAPPRARLQLLRIVQEALANTRKHAGARTVRLRMAGAKKGTMELMVADDGNGFEPQRVSAEGRFGLAMMRERARSVGGSLEIASAPGDGTRIVARVPRDARSRKGSR